MKKTVIQQVRKFGNKSNKYAPKPFFQESIRLSICSDLQNPKIWKIHTAFKYLDLISS